MYFSYNTIILFFTIVFENGFCALYEGDLCTIPSPKTNGVCKLLSSCPSALQDLQTKSIYPTNCGFKNNQPIVCCGDSSTSVSTLGNGPKSNKKTNPPSMTTITKLQPTHSITSKKVGERSKQKCIEYGKYVYVEAGVVPVFGRPAVPKVVECAVIGVENIVGGTPAKSKEFPHMALIGFQDDDAIQWLCGGSLISEKFVLSAAHCIFHAQYQDAKYVLLGELVLDSTADDADPQQMLIKRIIKHPEHLSSSSYNDIALFELERKARLSTYVRPACLNTNPNLSNRSIASGWGKTANFGAGTKELQKVTLEMFDTMSCNRTYGKKIEKNLAHGIIETQLCAGSRNESKDTCNGDSGGPLQVINKEVLCTYKIIGVTSFGKICGVQGIPAVYTRVDSYIKWIEDIVWP